MSLSVLSVLSVPGVGLRPAHPSRGTSQPGAARLSLGIAWRARLAWLGAALVVCAAPALWLPVQAQTQGPTVTLPDFADLAERVSPSVVNIRTTERGRNGAGPQGMDPNIE